MELLREEKMVDSMAFAMVTQMAGSKEHALVVPRGLS